MGDAFGNLNSLIGLLETATNGGDPWEVFITTQFGTTPPPGRALGGPVTAGQLYRVNEIGTEFFRPAVGGDIIPLGAGGGGGVATKVDNRVTNYNITTVEPVETAVAVSQRLRADAWLYST